MLPRTKLRNVWLGFLAVFVLGIFSQQLKADFIPPYDVSQAFVQPFNFPSGLVLPIGSWTLQASGTPDVYVNSFVQTNPSQLVLQTGPAILHGSQYALELQFTHTILGTGTLSFDYSLSLQETTGIFAGWNHGGYILDGVLTQLPAGTGSVSLSVMAGDVFAFDAFGTANCFGCVDGKLHAGATTLTITHFNAPVPEPATTTLLICGAGLALARVRARARSSRRSVDRLTRRS